MVNQDLNPTYDSRANASKSLRSSTGRSVHFGERLAGSRCVGGGWSVCPHGHEGDEDN